ncbi:hypothetical protein [Xylanibacter oryzae]|uniref:hypothetical protein n=1 Tax=Xylanibacter oryzae TaxID=185293 RepID=UPI0004AF8939|nr:hypothetical protein [Xylanibacter oryzae]
MNKNYLVIAVLMSVITLMSCTSSDKEDNVDPNACPAKVYLNLNTSSLTRVTTDPTNDEKTINGGYACAFDASGAKIGDVQHFDSYVSTSKPQINTTTQASQISVSANVSSAQTDFASVTKRNLFEGVTTLLANTTSNVQTYNSQDAKKLPMYGNTTLSFSNNSATPTVNLDHLVYKVQSSSISSNFSNTGYEGATFVPKEVFLYNANTTCTLDGATGSVPASGESSDASCAFTATNTSYLSSGAIASYNPATPTIYTFYAFPNTTSAPTKLVIKGTFTPSGGTAVTVYYPIVINKYQSNTRISLDGGSTYINSAQTDDSKVLMNHYYAISIVINGRGVDHVTDEINPSSATVQMLVNGWTSYQQIVTVK